MVLQAWCSCKSHNHVAVILAAPLGCDPAKAATFLKKSHKLRQLLGRITDNVLQRVRKQVEHMRFATGSLPRCK